MSDKIFNPYVSFAEARQMKGEYVQIIGARNPTTQVKSEPGRLSFSLADKTGGTIDVVYSDIKPLNFEHADQIVVLGKFNASQNVFVADKLLVKCPSKYTKKVN
jgi:cytochrome c-type biogenesis protein CcmE